MKAKVKGEKTTGKVVAINGKYVTIELYGGLWRCLHEDDVVITKRNKK